MSVENACGEASSSTDADGKEFSCSECGSVHETKRGLSIHESKSHGGPTDGSGIDCPGCERGFSCQGGLISHLSGVNTCGAGYECEECGQTHPTKRGLRHHKKETHGIDTRPEIACAVCGKTRQVDPNYLDKAERHFCGNECWAEWRGENWSGENNPNYKPRIAKECVACGDVYEVKPSRSDSIVCSPKCRGTWMRRNFSGENAFRWKGGSVRHYGDNWQEQRRRAMDRDNYTCQYCGKDMSGDGRDPDVHHLRRLKWYQDRYDAPEWWEKGNRLKNLVCACRPCHNQWEGVPVKPQLL